MRNLINIITENEDKFYYHITEKKNVESIFKNGLIPQQGNKTKLINDEHGVYLFPSIIAAEDGMNWMEDYLDDDDEIVLLKIKHNGTVRKISDWEYISPDLIPPQNISIENENF